MGSHQHWVAVLVPVNKLDHFSSRQFFSSEYQNNLPYHQGPVLPPGGWWFPLVSVPVFWPQPSFSFLRAWHRGSVRASHPAAPGSILVIPEELSLNVGRDSSTTLHCLDQVGSTEAYNVDWTSLVQLDGSTKTNTYFLLFPTACSQWVEFDLLRSGWCSICLCCWFQVCSLSAKCTQS